MAPTASNPTGQPRGLLPSRGRSGGFDKGRRLIRLPAIGLPLGMPASARYEPPRGFPCQIRRGPGRLESNRGPRPILRFFAPADRRFAPPLRERQREQWRARRVGGASGPAGRLERVQQVCTEQVPAQLTAFNSLPLLFLSGHLKRFVWPPCRVGASQDTGPPLHPQGHPKILSNRSAESILRPHPCARSLCGTLGQSLRAGGTCPGLARGPHPSARPSA